MGVVANNETLRDRRDERDRRDRRDDADNDADSDFSFVPYVSCCH